MKKVITSFILVTALVFSLFACKPTTYKLVVTSNDTTMGIVSGGGDFSAKAQVTVTAEAKTGYKFDGWFDGSIERSKNASYSFEMTEADLTLLGKFSSNTTVVEKFVTLDVNAENGSVSGNAGKYKPDDSVSLTATPDDGYEFAGWYEGDTKKSDTNPYTFSMPDDNLTLTAKFESKLKPITEYTLTVNAENGSVSGNAGKYKPGDSVTLTATPDDGYEFAGWTNGDNAVSVTNPYIFSMPANNLTLTALFTDANLSDGEKLAIIKDDLDDEFDGKSFESKSTSPFYATSLYSSTITWTTVPADMIVNGKFVEVDSDTAVEVIASINIGSLTNQEHSFDITITPYVAKLASDLFISEYYEGSGNNRAIELYNGTGASINLSNYILKQFYNGGEAGLGERELILSGILKHGKTFVIVNPDSSADLKALANMIDKAYPNFSSFTGDDPVGLYKIVGENHKLIDIIGFPGSSDKFGVDQSITRKPDVLEGNTAYDPNEWTSTDPVFTGLGNHEYDYVGDISFTLNISSEDIAKGTVTDVSGDYAYGSLVTLTATPEEGYRFDAWYRDDVVYDTNASFELRLTTDVTLVAKFVDSDVPMPEYPVTFNQPEGGTVTAEVSGTAINSGDEIEQNTNVDFSIVVADTHVFDGWYINDVKVGSELTFTHQIIATVTVEARLLEKASKDIIIYEVYGGGGNSKATFTHDYVVLYNLTDKAINLSGYSLQYASAAGEFGSNVNNTLTLSGTIGANSYYLIQLASGGNVGSALPVTPDITSGTPNLSGTAGKVALVKGTEKASGSSDVGVVDFVGFGTTANDYLGDKAPAPSNSTSIQRTELSVGTNNSTDFKAITPNLEYLLATVEFDVEFDTLGGSNVDTQTVNGGQLATRPVTDPTKDGYTFVNWYDAETDGAVFDFTAAVKSDLTVYARWEATDYSVTYNLDGGTNNEDNPATYTIESETITLLDPTKEGYTFVGWFDALTDGNEIEEITAGTKGNVELFARWSTVIYSVTYNLDDGTNNEDNPATYTIESETITLLDPTKEGYTFVGWFDALTDGNEIEEITAGTKGNVELFARWLKDIAGEYVVQFHTDGGSAVSAQQVIEGGQATRPDTDPTKKGYTFVNWYTAATEGELFDFTSAINAPTTVYARWTKDLYTITYNDPKDVENNNPVSYQVDTATFALNNLELSGYDFLGWFDEETDGTKVTSVEVGSVGNVVLYARWSTVTYSVTYNLDGGANNPANPETYTVESETINLSDPAKDGFTFLGWFDDEDEGTKVTSIEVNSTGDLVLYARWARTLTDVATAKEAASGATVYLGGVVTGVYTNSGSTNNTKIYVSDEDGSSVILLILNAMPEGLKVGDLVEVLGDIRMEGGVKVVASGATVEIKDTNQTLPDTNVVTSVTGLTVADYGKVYSIANLVVTATYISGTRMVAFTDGTNPVQIRSDYYSYTELNDFLSGLKVGEKVNLLHGHLGFYNGTLQFSLFASTDIELVQLTDLEKLAIIKDYLNELYNNKSFASGMPVVLAATFDDYSATISWSANPDLIDGDNWKKVNVDTEIVLTASISVGDLVNQEFDVDATLLAFTSEVSFTVTRADFTGATSGYNNMNWVKDGISGKGNIFAGTTTYIQLNPDNTPLPHNTTPTPGAIIKIEVIMPGSGSLRALSPVMSTSNVVDTKDKGTSLTEQTFASNSGTLTWEIAESLDYHYFLLLIPSGATNWASFTITYSLPTTKYDVNFDTDGGSTVEPQKVVEDLFATRPAVDPAKEGYTFVNWFDSATEGELFDFNAPITADTTVYARWSVINYDVIYNLDDGFNHEDNPLTYNIETPTISLGDPTKDGFTFNGWYTAADGGDKVEDIVSGSTGDVVLYARWTENVGEDEVAVSFHFENGSDHVEVVVVEKDSLVSALETDPVYSGYIFLGWFVAKDGDTAFDFDAPITANTSIYAHWQLKAVVDSLTAVATGNVKVDKENDGDEFETALFEVEFYDDETLVVTKWFSLSATSYLYQNETADKIYNANVSLSDLVKAVGHTYTGKHDWNYDRNTYYYEVTWSVDGVPISKDVVATSYLLYREATGWETRDLGEAGAAAGVGSWVPNNYNVIKEVVVFDGVVYYTEYTYAQFNYITFIVDGATNKYAGEHPATGVLDTAKIPADPIKEEKIFIGWFLETAEFAFDLSTPLNENIVLFAKFVDGDASFFSVEFDTDGGTEIATINGVLSGSRIQKPADPEKGGFVFKGWFIDSEFVTAFDFETDTIEANMILFAKWDVDVPEPTVLTSPTWALGGNSQKTDKTDILSNLFGTSANGILTSILSNKNSASNVIATNAAEIRMYYGTNGDGSGFTINMISGFKAVSITIYAYGNGTGTGILSVAGQTVNLATKGNNSTGDNHTFTLANLDSIIIKNASTTNCQTRVTGIEITYIPA